MTITSPSWDQPAWAIVAAAAPGWDRLIATLRATRAACDATVAVTPRADGFDAASGWQSADGLLALLELQCSLPAVAELTLEPAPSPEAAAGTVDQLLRAAAGATLIASESLRGGGNTHQLLVLASVMGQLSATYERVFGRPW